MKLPELSSIAPRSRQPLARRAAGFTLVEVVLVLILLAILALVIIGRLTSPREVEAAAQAATLKNHLRYAQLRAINSGGPAAPDIWGIEKVGDGYRLFRREEDGGLTTFRFPAEESDTVTAPLLEWAGGFSLVGFDYYGRPFTDLIDFTPQAGEIKVAGGAHAVTITRETGFIP
ncbi:MAG TPA: prepilin-type N-terminal cleavage/methylation domain-containing protein [Desulfurivibrio alkaliphilus]|uniref:Prepilin-type N-terminal cleavage/methylation domain-containing protein n=1 Tax=Desulfurivibrio alkaliphilus TaxID=427923 RepID=A0A7C2XUR5_9BACT|nr:prepilin-type N-terminal cleavage/methylation domain-containing protein [Desulfurivibrio alkaliphilus]